MAENGKSYWEIAPNPLGGRPLKYKNAQVLWEKFLDYCKWVDDNPWQEKQATNSMVSGGDDQRNAVQQNVKVSQRAYTLYGFCAFAGIYKWGDFKRNYSEKKGFLEVIESIENIVTAHQVDGALIRKFDSNLVARLNGIADKTITEVTGKDGSDFMFPKLSIDDLQRLKDLNDRL